MAQRFRLTRLPAAENLVGYSTSQPSLFKRNQLEPVTDLKLLIKDYAPIAKNALTILVNLTDDEEIVKKLIEDEACLESILRRVTVRRNPKAKRKLNTTYLRVETCTKR